VATVRATVVTSADDGEAADLRAARAAAGAAPRTASPVRPAGPDVVPGREARPDLAAVPAWQISVGAEPGKATGSASTRQYLSFAATVWNAGPSPLVVDGFRRPGRDLMDAYQYFYDRSGREVGRARTGTLEFDNRDGHEHWHFTDFARYQLLNANKTLAVRSGKEAFCLAPTDVVDLLRRGATWHPDSIGLHTACGGPSSLALREILQVGWGDTYTQGLPGQSFDITDLPNGTYYIEVTANPDNRLHEVSTANNRALRTVILGGTRAKRTVTVPPYEGLRVP
jgi:hypothetical protein